MDAATLAMRVRYGYGRAANVVGRSTTIYRAVAATPAIVPQNFVATRLAAFDTVPEFTFVNPQKIGATNYYALIDATGMQVGDYMVSRDGTYFAATVDDIAPPMVIRCQRVITVYRPGSKRTGAKAYGGFGGDPILTAWPAAIVDRGRRQAGETHLPHDMDIPWMEVLLPTTLPVQLLPMDVISDDQDRPAHYTIGSAAQFPTGWRLSVRLTVA